MSNDLLDGLFVAVACGCPVVALFLLWLRNPDSPESAAVGTWCAVGVLVIGLVALVRRRP